MGCPLVVHYWADLQSLHELRYYDNITRTRNVSEYMLVLALCLVDVFRIIVIVIILLVVFRWRYCEILGNVTSTDVTH